MAQNNEIVKRANAFAKAFSDWRFQMERKWPSDELIEAANELTDVALNWESVDYDGQRVEVWRMEGTSDWYIGTPAGTNVGPLMTREQALTIAACHFSNGPALNE